MSILFVLFTFLIVISVNYFYFRLPVAPIAQTDVVVHPRVPVMAKESGFAIPKDYSFHPGHTWVSREASDNARIGMDKFGADLVGSIDRIEVSQPSRWIRQGQRLATIHSGDITFDLLSPVEGVVMAINNDVVNNPSLATSDPYKDGWLAVLKSPDLPTNEKNLLHGSMVAPWMHYGVSRLKEVLANANPALAQDGGLPLNQVMQHVETPLRHKLIKEFFLN